MPTYICYKCGCIDNTACGGNYWAVSFVKNSKKHEPMFKDDFANTHELCAECAPTEFIDGSKNKEAGKWHGKFEKRHWSEHGTKEELIKASKTGQGNTVNAVAYFEYLEAMSRENVITQDKL